MNNGDDERTAKNIACNILAQRDSAMEDLKKIYPDIVRIIGQGPSCQKDIKIVKKCLMFCVGEIRGHLREFENVQYLG